MGAVTFSLDPLLLDALAASLPFDVFVETGTFHGDTVALAAPRFSRVVTIEHSQALWQAAVERFRADPQIEVLPGESPEVLARVSPSLAERATLFWLDAHWCAAEHTAGEHSQCPLLDELAAIGTLAARSVVLIDDARLFLTTPPHPHDVTQWPSFDAIARALRDLSPTHELMVVNDVIAFFPSAARAALVEYAREHGVDWLRARQSEEENVELRRAVEEKEAALHDKEAALHAKHADVMRFGEALREKEAALHDKEAALHAKHADVMRFDEALREKDLALARAHDELEERARAIGELDAELARRGSGIAARDKDLEGRGGEIARLRQDLQAKELEIERKHADLLRSQAELVAKEHVIQEQHAALKRMHAAVLVLTPARNAWRALRERLVGTRATLGPVRRALRPFAAAARDARRMLRPRLGVLYQHPPIPLGMPVAGAPPRHDLPRISLVTPSFRQAGFIGRTVESVLSQGYPGLEYFIQDGGSEDGTVEVLRAYEGRIAGWDSRRDSGQSQAINRAFARTSGEIMGWLNSDDILLPGALAAIGDFFARHPDVDVVYGHRVLIDENDAEIGRWIMPPHDDAVLAWADFVPQETMFWRRRIWDKAGGRIDESFRFAMDWDLIVRFRQAGARFARVTRFIGGFRIHPHQKTSAAIGEVGFQEMNRIRERLLGRVPSPVEVRRAVAPYLLRHLLTDLAWRARRRLGAAE